MPSGLLKVSTGSDARFKFGENWQRYLASVNHQRIAAAEDSLKQMLGIEHLEGMKFVDVGSGSGLFSLAARRLGARVQSFDYDPQAVACTRELKSRYLPDDPDWSIEVGSALDRTYLETLGVFDVVYSWGVLHHTGDMWQALDNVSALADKKARLFIAIYNDQGIASKFWWHVKRAYNQFPDQLRFLILWPAFVRLWGPTIIRDFIRGKGLYTWKSYSEVRGMSAWWDVIDWVGGYPFEVAKPQQITDFYQSRGYSLVKQALVGRGSGCNQFVFEKQRSSE